MLVKTFQPSERASEFETLEVPVTGPFCSENTRLLLDKTSAYPAAAHTSVEYLKVVLIQTNHESHHDLHSLHHFDSGQRPVLPGPDELPGK